MNLEYSIVCMSLAPLEPNTRVFVDRVPVRAVSTMLEPAGRLSHLLPVRLPSNAGVAFEGCKPNGDGFLIGNAEALEILSISPEYSKVIRPYLGGKDINSRPGVNASRWAIDFVQMSEGDARRFGLPFSLVEERVKPARQGSRDRTLRDRWWLYEKPRPALRAAIDGLQHLFVIALTSRSVMPVRVSSDQVFSNSLGVFALQGWSDLSILSSTAHQVWAITYGSAMRSDPRYTPSDVFDTFPRPEATQRLEDIGRILDDERRKLMVQRRIGLTDLYKEINNPEIQGHRGIDCLRELHLEIDAATFSAYGWSDMALDHGFHAYRQMERWTVSPVTRAEMLDRLLELNHQRAREEGLDVPDQVELF